MAGYSAVKPKGMVWQSLRNENVMSGALFRGENENLSSNADFIHKTSNLVISRCSFADDNTIQYNNLLNSPQKGFSEPMYLSKKKK